MLVQEPGYHLPKGYSSFQVMLRALRLARSPITEIDGNMKKFAGTYTAVFPGNIRLVLTQDPGFINHVLRERHTNYKKSEMSSGRGALLFGNGLVFSNGDYWLQQRRLIQPGFFRYPSFSRHKSKPEPALHGSTELSDGRYPAAFQPMAVPNKWEEKTQPGKVGDDERHH